MSAVTAPPPPAARLPALDWLRGLVMAVMAVDHVDGALNPKHSNADGVLLGGDQVTLSAPDFLTRFCTHLCAPTFVFLAGTSMALSVARAERRGTAAWHIDRHWLLRGLVLVGLEGTLVSFYWRQEMAQVDVFLQVLFALGVGLMLMVPLRRLPTWALVASGLLLPLVCEGVFAAVGPSLASPGPLATQLLFTGGAYPSWTNAALLIIYPALPWLPAMLLGFGFGRALASGLSPAAARRGLAAAGAMALVAFAMLRQVNHAFTNMQLRRGDDSLLQWLHASKYPPSVTFLCLELGLMALLLAALFWWQEQPRAGNWKGQPIYVLGQVPLFFYLLHLPLIGALMYGGVLPRPSPWTVSWGGALLLVLLAWPLCWLYRRYKQTGRHAWTRYL